MIFAVIPWTEAYNNNELFNINSMTNRDGLAEPFVDMKDYLEKNGHTINTIDLYDDLTKVDYFLFFEWVEEWIYKLVKKGYAGKMVYCNAEPPTVKILNTEEGFKTVKKYFQFVMTWNLDLVDNKRVFFRTIPYRFMKHTDNVPYENKKLITSISANKKSDYKDELYSERERLISFFENELSDQFDMYGVGWNSEEHQSYKGSPVSKFSTYNHYKFAIAFENTKNVNGYITEKIFDCLTGGIVPIYYGAENITDHVSTDCFIDYRNFNNLYELKDFLLHMTKEEYYAYLRAAELAMESNELKEFFSGKKYAQNIIEMCNEGIKEKIYVHAKDIIIMGLKVKMKFIKRKIKIIVN